jgi:hypothetical protein
MTWSERLRDERGIATSLIEATTVIAIAAILTSVAMIAASDQADDASLANTQGEVKLIGLSILSFMQDNGFAPVFRSGNARGLEDEIFLVLESGGSEPDDATGQWSQGLRDHFDHHLVHNTPGTDSLADVISAYPRVGQVTDRLGEPVSRTRGWNGPYMSRIPPADPWDGKYLSNVGLLTARGEEIARTAFNLPEGLPPAVFVISAGPNRSIETKMVQPTELFVVGGDDIVFRIQ